jgi:hypothetical protein
MEGVKMWLSSQAADFLTQAYKNKKFLNSSDDYIEK